jgi:CRISPR-associated Csx2 family protein
MRKVFVAFLGTGHYGDCIYYTDANDKDNNNQKTPYIQEYLIKKYCSDWTENDKVLFFITDQARKKNWENEKRFFTDINNSSEKEITRKGEVYKRINEKKIEKENIGLEQRLNNLGLNVPVEAIKIEDGKSEKEQWSIFNEIFHKFNKDDEVMFDVTHGFRYLPIFMIVLINYLKVTKGITLKNIFYGAFEAVPRPDINKPIFDLSSINYLQEWSNAVYNFIKNGIVQDIKDLIVKEDQGGLIEIYTILDEFSKYISTSNIKGILELQFDKVVWSIKLLKNNHGSKIEPLNPIFDMLLDKVEPFNTENIIQKGLHCVQWCIDYNLLQQGYTILTELIPMFYISIVNYKNRTNYDYYNYNDRNFFKKVILGYDIPENRNKEKQELELKLKGLKQECSNIDDLKTPYRKISETRNKINHGTFEIPAFFNNQKYNQYKFLPDLLKKVLTDYYDAVKALIKKITSDLRINQ